MITQTSLRSILVTIFSVDEDYVVPKQGNWYNPQESIAPPEAPITWVAFALRLPRPRVRQYFQKRDPDAGQYSTVLMTARVDLQIVGAAAEEVANSVAHWMDRSDVQELFDAEQAQLMADELGTVDITDFDQDGINIVWAYNVRFWIQYASTIEANQSRLETAEFTSTLTPQ